MKHMLQRAIVPALLVAAPVATFAASPAQAEPANSAPASSQTSAAADTLYKETFELGTHHWSTSRHARIKAVDNGRRSDQAARLQASARGAVARTKVPTSDVSGARNVVSAWLRSTRGGVRATLVAREIEPSTGKVLSTHRDRVKVGNHWRRAKVAVVRTSSTSQIKVAVRTTQGRGDRVLLDDVSVRRAKKSTTTTPPSTPPSTPPAPTPPAGNGAFPNAANTGVPDGLGLSAYSGPMTVTTAGTVIDAKQITGTLLVKAPNVTVTRSKVSGSVFVEGSGSLTMSDSTVDGGTSENSAVGQRNLTLRRVEIVGARVSVGCDANCDVQDSWLHAQYIEPGSDWHGDGFLSNGGSNMTLRHNTLACDSKPTGSGGACSAALAAYGDFSPIQGLTVDNNYFVPSPAGYCMYGGYDPAKPFGKSAANVKVTNNVFARGSNGKCAAFGAAAAVATSGNGNVWSGNVWDDGKAVSVS